MWRPKPTARPHDDAQSRTLYACFGVSLALHGLAMIGLPGWRTVEHRDEAGSLTVFAAVAEPAAVAAASVARAARERREHKPELPAPEPVPAAAPASEAPAPAPSAEPQEPAAVASSAPQPSSADAQAAAPAPDASLLEAYRLALIDAAKRYKRYPTQAMERGWEGRVEIRLVVDANGTIKSALVKSSSRYQILDDQALDMVRRAFNALAQVKPAPRGREFTVDVPVIFELQTG